MEIRNKELLSKYATKHANARNALQHWINFVEEVEWKSHNELKLDFPSADYVGNERYVLNIQGNNHRLVAIAVFIEDYLKIRFIGTHAEYDKIDCKTI
ncbi:MAG: type II toxin-antitoxin system HigB family toxin [Dysgonamonadaceae bacterium]|jgi:mRNA interferase HigB|nr:type II toxin-antitoxin system HigB family toxin [Dysgonamonadaceae bacterium]